jgi:ATP-dependent DNA helicase RecQ
MSVDAVIEELARNRLGFERLRPGQRRAAEGLAGGRDVLAVLPTGGGKSAIYELAGLLRSGPTVVVSPLIALQDDQLAHLRAAGLSAIVLNSQQSAGARAAALLAACDSGTFVFLSPEQLANEQTRETLLRYDGDQVTVLFDEHGYRELFVPVVLDRGLLRLA